jgi:hypothetical protein
VDWPLLSHYDGTDTISEYVNVNHRKPRFLLIKVRTQIFEASLIKTEIGAGVGIPRNALRILKLFGYSRDNLKAVDFDGVRSLAYIAGS